MDEEMLLPTEVAIRIPNHRFFIFEIYRLIQKELGKDVDFKDLLEFLDTDHAEMHIFMRTRRPPRDWLMKIVRSEEGPQILDYFGVYYGDPMMCFSSNQKEEKWVSTEIEKLLDISGLSGEVVKTEELLTQGVLDEADLIESLELPDEVEITDEAVVSVNECLQKLNELSTEVEVDNNLNEKNNISEEGEYDMNTDTAIISGSQELSATSEKRGDETNSAIIVHDENHPIVIAPENRLRFLAGLQSREVLNLPDAFICKDKLGAVELNAFEETGIVPEKWVTILREANKEDFLRGYFDTAQGEALAKNNASESSPTKRAHTKQNEDELVPKEVAALAIDRIVRKSGFKSNAELAVFLGLNPAACSMIKGRTMRLRISDVERVAKRAGIEKAVFFEKVGLGFLLKDNQGEAMRTEVKSEADKPMPSGGIQNRSSNADGAKKGVSIGGVSDSEWVRVNQVIQVAFFKSGGIPEEGIRREFFFGYLVINLSGYCVEFLENGNKVRVSGQSGAFEFELGHIPF